MKKRFGIRIQTGAVASPVAGATMTLALTAGTHEGDSTTAVSGVAPLYVFFDASDSTSTATSNPFHDCLYTWDFGDSGAGDHARGAFAGTSQASRNASQGACAGHVFETPSATPYTVTLTGKDGGLPVTKTITVTVRDGSAAEWAGARTMLVSTSGNFTCAGLTNSGNAIHHTWVDWPTFNAAFTAMCAAPSAAGNSFGAGPGRAMFRTGETFPINSGGNSYQIRSPSGPTHLCSYNDSGPCQGADATIAGDSGTADFGLLQLGFSGTLGMKGMTIRDLTLDASAVTAAGKGFGIFPKSNLDWLLMQRLTFNSVNCVCVQYSVNTDGGNTPSGGYHVWDGIALVDCVQQNPQSGAGKANSLFYQISKRTYCAGNLGRSSGDLTTGWGSHNIRFQWFDRAVIEHNTFQYPGSTQHAIKMHSDEVYCWGNQATGAGPTTYALGVMRRPFMPVQAGILPVKTQYPVFEVTTAGTTNADEPGRGTQVGNPWNQTVGATTTDGTVVWTCRDYATISPNKLTWRSDGYGYASSKAVVRCNRLTARTTPWPMAMGPLDNDDFSKVYDVVVEQNWWDCNEAGSATQNAFRIWAERVTVRNNIADLTNGAFVQFFLPGMRTPAPSSTYPAKDVWIYNNSLYCAATANSTIDGVAIDSYAEGIVAKNNLLYCPGLGAKTLTVINDSAAAVGQVTKSNNTGDVGTPTTSPSFSGALTSPAGWQIVDTGSYTKDTGATVPVWTDFFGNTRTPGSIDIGASEQ